TRADGIGTRRVLRKHGALGAFTVEHALALLDRAPGMAAARRPGSGAPLSLPQSAPSLCLMARAPAPALSRRENAANSAVKQATNDNAKPLPARSEPPRASSVAADGFAESELDGVEQAVGGKGLGQQHDAFAPGVILKRVVGEGRGENDFRLRPILADRFGELGAQDERHAHVDDAEIVGVARQHLVAVDSVLRRDGFYARRFEDLDQEPAKDVVVVDDQD